MIPTAPDVPFVTVQEFFQKLKQYLTKRLQLKCEEPKSVFACINRQSVIVL